MPKILLSQGFVVSPPACPTGKSKIDYFDSQLPGFLLEVRPSGKCTYYQRYRDRYGRMKQVRLGPTDALSLDEARQRAKQIRSQATMGFDPRAEDERLKNIPTFKKFVEDKYLPFVKVHKKSWELDKNLIDSRIMPLWGKMKLSEITREDVEEFKSTFVQLKYKPSSINRFLALVKYIFNLAEKWEIIAKTPARNVKKLEDNNHRERYLSGEETERLLSELTNCESTVVPDIVEFLILTGARKSEATKAKWKEINFESTLWTIPVENSKSGKSRYVPLSISALKVLERRKGNENEYIFPNPKTGKPIRHFHNTWDRIRKNAGIPDVRIHDLRHNFASLLINNGRSLYEVQKLLGHADFSTTQRYAHLAQNTLQEATEVVSQKIRSESTSALKK